MIQTLHQENVVRNKQYTQIFLALSLISIIPYVPTLFSPRTSLLSLLSISSLLSTSYLLYILPPGTTSISLLDTWNTPTSEVSHSGLRQVQDHGPLQQYLPYLNLGLCTILGLLGMVFRGKEEVWRGFGWLPAGVYVVVLISKVVMGSVDPEAELGRFRYDFKGA